MSPLSAADRRLLEAAIDVLTRNYDPERHTVGAAVRCASGELYKGVDIEACGYGPCAEPIALGAALTAGEREFEAIVAVARRGDDFVVLSPCGNCRQLLLDYCPDARVLVPGSDGPAATLVRELLPNPYLSGFSSTIRAREESAQEPRANEGRRSTRSGTRPQRGGES